MADEQHAEQPGEIAEQEIFFAINDRGSISVGFTAEEARDQLLETDGDGVAMRAFSIMVRARKPHVELGPVIDIADETVAPAEVLPAASRASHHSA